MARYNTLTKINLMLVNFRASSCVAPLRFFTGVLAQSVALRVRCPGPLGPCSLVWSFGAFYCVYGVLGHLAPVHQCVRSVSCAGCAVS